MSAAARRKGVYKGVAICRRGEEDGESEIKHEQIPGFVPDDWWCALWRTNKRAGR